MGGTGVSWVPLGCLVGGGMYRAIGTLRTPLRPYPYTYHPTPRTLPLQPSTSSISISSLLVSSASVLLLIWLGLGMEFHSLWFRFLLEFASQWPLTLTLTPPHAAPCASHWPPFSVPRHQELSGSTLAFAFGLVLVLVLVLGLGLGLGLALVLVLVFASVLVLAVRVRSLGLGPHCGEH